MTRAGGEDADVGEGLAARVHRAVRGVARNVDDAAGRQRNELAVTAFFVLEKHCAAAAQSDVDLGGGTPEVKMSLGHVVFVTNTSRHDRADADRKSVV